MVSRNYLNVTEVNFFKRKVMLKFFVGTVSVKTKKKKYFSCKLCKVMAIYLLPILYTTKNLL